LARVVSVAPLLGGGSSRAAFGADGRGRSGHGGGGGRRAGPARWAQPRSLGTCRTAIPAFCQTTSHRRRLRRTGAFLGRRSYSAFAQSTESSRAIDLR